MTVHRQGRQADERSRVRHHQAGPAADYRGLGRRGVYAYVQPDGTWWINNTGFLVGPQGVISIDACSTERRTRAYQAAIAKVTPAPVRTLLNTHHHGDHTFGNALFPTATIVAHERARAEAIAFGPAREFPFWENPDWGQLPLEPPFLTFTEEIALRFSQ